MHRFTAAAGYSRAAAVTAADGAAAVAAAAAAVAVTVTVAAVTLILAVAVAVALPIVAGLMVPASAGVWLTRQAVRRVNVWR